ncbi:hypothetical protein BASA50_004969 [Batrachochytrium salamandrivorans]|uniref:SCP domain-containing protein n=1 Tax=Batrachochytrium salamandrivorans TaxID=1357716 RepID=A0ABQ8FE06_9FUNG|nr:hypothetical protein BASA60_000505 [Batrachochytrium salamandrivorans]KAH6596638.1 hypothetical protein BASA50_004969 [Batrachochytrium salamandrivorans]KAH9249603.1 hypothetical protein BASA81_012677 [Batrachochytrium salamandrivorans]KAJ1340074.1 hypothetical protein BSLG_005285 [Batrachochytrium salamandrivorans]
MGLFARKTVAVPAQEAKATTTTTTTTTTKTVRIINGKPVTSKVVQVVQKQTNLKAPIVTTTTTTVVQPSKSIASLEKPPSTDKPTAVLALECIERHNYFRSLAKLPPLVWSMTLAKASQKWANHLAATNKFEHSHGKVGLYGENLYWSTSSEITCEAAMKAFYAERSLYHGEPITADNCRAVGHYTQIMWPSTTHVGCAVAFDKTRKKYTMVFEYWPPGNVIGQCAPY